MKNIIIDYNFLPMDQYSLLKSEIYDLDLNELKSGRSSLDLPESKINTPQLERFNSLYTNNAHFWGVMLNRFKLGHNYDFKNHIEPDNGVFQTNEKFMYGRMDVGFGIEGYGEINGGKGNHIDNFNRVISCLLYFSDQDDFNGGEFEVTDKYGNTLQSLKIRENMCIMSVQDKDGWHRVNPVKALLTGKPRVAIYFALSATWKYFNR